MPLADGMGKNFIGRKPEEMDMAWWYWAAFVGVCFCVLSHENGYFYPQSGGMQSAIIAAIVSLSMGVGLVAMYTFFQCKIPIDMVANAVCSGVSAQQLPGTWDGVKQHNTFKHDENRGRSLKACLFLFEQFGYEVPK